MKDEKIVDVIQRRREAVFRELPFMLPMLKDEFLCDLCDNAKKLKAEHGFYRCPCGGALVYTGESLGLQAVGGGTLVTGRCPRCDRVYHLASDEDVEVGDRLSVPGCGAKRRDGSDTWAVCPACALGLLHTCLSEFLWLDVDPMIGEFYCPCCDNRLRVDFKAETIKKVG